MRPAEIGRLDPGLRFLQDPDDLFFRKPLLHRLLLLLRLQTLSHFGDIFGENVTMNIKIQKMEILLLQTTHD